MNSNEFCLVPRVLRSDTEKLENLKIFTFLDAIFGVCFKTENCLSNCSTADIINTVHYRFFGLLKQNKRATFTLLPAQTFKVQNLEVMGCFRTVPRPQPLNPDAKSVGKF